MKKIASLCAVVPPLIAIVLVSVSVRTSASPTRFVESVRVLATGQQALSTYATKPGATYSVVVSGWFTSRVSPPGCQDVRYLSEDNWASWGFVPDDAQWMGTVFRWHEGGILYAPMWGEYSPAHVYATDYVGRGDRLSFFIYDNYYGDNSGWLTADVYEVVPEPSTLLALDGGMGALCALRRRRSQPSAAPHTLKGE